MHSQIVCSRIVCSRIVCPRAVGILVAIVLGLAAAPAASAPAAASLWTDSGIDVVRSLGDQLAVGLGSDGARGVYVTWMDSAEGPDSTDVFVQRIAPDGSVVSGWPGAGRDLTPVPGEQFVSDLVATERGPYLVWDDGRRFRDHDVYGIRLDPDGAVGSTWPRTGLALTTPEELAIRSGARLTADSMGVLATWQNFGERPIRPTLAIQRLADAGGHPAPWPSPTILDQEGAVYDRIEGFVSDGAGGAFVVWYGTPEFAPSEVRVQHVYADGSLDTTFPPLGRLVGRGLIAWSTTAVASRPGGGFFVGWMEDMDSVGETAELRIHRFDASGAVDDTWADDGAAIGSGVPFTQPVQFAPGLDGGCLLARAGLPAEGGGLFVTRFDSSGEVVGGPGLRVAESTPSAHHLVADGAGGAFVAWAEWSEGMSVLWMQRVGADGARAPLWPEGGLRLTPSPADHFIAALQPDGAGGAYVLWNVNRGPDTYNDVVLQRVTWDGRLASQIPDPIAACGDADLRIFPNPMRTTTSLCFGPGLLDPDTIQILDGGGRSIRHWSSLRWTLDARDRPFEWDGRDDDGESVASGVYWVRATSRSGSASRRLTVIR